MKKYRFKKDLLYREFRTNETYDQEYIDEIRFPTEEKAQEAADMANKKYTHLFIKE